MHGFISSEDKATSMPERDPKGRFSSESGVTVEDVLDGIGQGETVTTSDIEDKFGIPYRTAKKYLDILADRGVLAARKPNPRLVLYTRE